MTHMLYGDALNKVCWLLASFAHNKKNKERDAAQGLHMVAVTPISEQTKKPFRRAARLCALIPLLVFADAAAQENNSLIDLADLSLEELANITITSVSRRQENLSTAPASIFVITSEDIGRSGAATLPEILRLAPNLQVARMDSTQYAISARGFNNSIGNKLLVLIDGRTVYTPLFSGVFWEMQDVIPENIDRIEVISGPGATLWGANAVNGVINIITRDSAATQGLLLSADAGNRERGLAVSGGGSAGTRTSFRLYGKTREWERNDRTNGTRAVDEWKRSQAGFRVDWKGEARSLTVQGDTFKGESEARGTFGPFIISPVDVSGSNLLLNWSQQLAPDSDLRVRAYWSHSQREEIVIFSPDENIVDIDMQYDTRLRNHHLLLGGGYREGKDEVEPGLFTALIPDSRTLNWENVFVQDEITLTPTLKAVLGVKLEWNDYTGREALPSARLAWQLNSNHMLWTSISRAVRAPSRYDRDVYLPQNSPYIVAGGPGFESEVARVIELGYRGQASAKLNYSITLFHNDWDRLRSGTNPPLPTYLANNIEGESYGVEAWGNWQVTENWRLSAGLSTLEKDLRFRNGQSDTVGVDNATLHNDPDYQWSLRSSMSLSDTVSLDLHLRRVGQLSVEPVPGYTELNTRLAWRPTRTLELSLIGNDLLNAEHAEFGAPTNRSEFRPSYALGLRWSP